MEQTNEEKKGFRHPPMSLREMEWRDWTHLDVILISGDAFIDHPSFEIAVLGRVLETMGLHIGFIAQPDWRDLRQFTQLKQPRLFFVISAGKNDSMVANYSPTKRPRKIDFFSPGRVPGLRPDRAGQVYANACKEVYPEVPVILTGLEASSRRLAHYDFWDDNLRKGILADCAADLLIYGQAERGLTQIARILARDGSPLECRNIRGLVYKIPKDGKTEAEKYLPSEYLAVPGYDQLQTAKQSFVDAFKIEYRNADYYRDPKALLQEYDDCILVQTPPQKPLSTGEMDRIFSLPFSRTPHPRYREAGPIPSFETVKFGLITHRGCFGDCTFCVNRQYEGRYISQRSKASILEEAMLISGLRYFRGWISNVGGLMANMYGMGCSLEEEDKLNCERMSCLEPGRCEHLNTSHAEYLDLLRAIRSVDGVEQCFLSSCLRIDLLEDEPLADEFLEEIMRYFLSGHLKMPFEHVSAEVNQKVRKYGNGVIEGFIRRFYQIAKKPGLEGLFITPYFISSHPGSRMENALEIALFLKKHEMNTCQIQDFVPNPGTPSTCMYYTGIDPFTDGPVYRPLAYRERKLQRSLFHFYKPQNERYVFDALKDVDRMDLVGPGSNCLLKEEPKWSPFD